MPSQFDGRFLRPEDLPALISLRRTVLANLPDPDLYVVEDDEAEYLQGLCGEKGRTYGVFDHEFLVAYGALGLPGPFDEDNLGWQLGWLAEKRQRIAHIESCMVLPAYRGYAFQRFLLQVRFAVALAAMRRYAVAMVSLKNHQSRHNMLEAGMHLSWIGELSHGRKRQLMVADLLASRQGHPDARLILDANDYAAQRAATQAGLEGWRDKNEDGRTFIEFG